MPSLEAKRTLVKSPPEIWAEVSDAGALARHLGEFGEIRITRTQPESVVEWEGDLASGCVRLEPSGWGTKVTLTAEAADAAGARARARARAGAGARPRAAGQAVLVEPLPAPPRGGRAPRRPLPEPVAAEAAPAPPARPRSTRRAEAALTNVLDTLGAAHHRPFSRP